MSKRIDTGHTTVLILTVRYKNSPLTGRREERKKERERETDRERRGAIEQI